MVNSSVVVCWSTFKIPVWTASNSGSLLLVLKFDVMMVCFRQSSCTCCHLLAPIHTLRFPAFQESAGRLVCTVTWPCWAGRQTLLLWRCPKCSLPVKKELERRRLLEGRSCGRGGAPLSASVMVYAGSSRSRSYGNNFIYIYIDRERYLNWILLRELFAWKL